MESQDLLLQGSLKNVLDGIPSRDDLERVRRAVLGGRLGITTGERGISVGGDASEATFVTGNHNVILTGISGESARKLLAAMQVQRPGSAPQIPGLFVGREEDIHKIKQRLGVGGEIKKESLLTLTAVRGWPGIGKTTLAAALAHDEDVGNLFSDGVLWVSLGPEPDPFSALAGWGRALGNEDLLRARSIEESSAQLSAILRDKRMLLIVDDVWQIEHVKPFEVGGRDCAMLVTTRQNEVAQAIAPLAEGIYKLHVLDDEASIQIFEALCPSVVRSHRDKCLELIHELEGLPLALQVSGRLLNTEAEYGFGVSTLIDELRSGAKILEARAPQERIGLASETSATVAVLFQKSTDRLDEHIRDCFAFLGPFAPKPATFDLDAMKFVWQVEDPKPIVRTLVDRGLLEPVGDTGKYQMHALLIAHAKSLLT